MARTTQARREARDQIRLENVNRLLDRLTEKLGCKNDAALSRELNLSPPQISKLRHGANLPTAAFLVPAHEKTGIPFSDIRKILEVGPEYRF